LGSFPAIARRVLKISSGSNPRTVAGAISHISRQGECPNMLATGASSINQAIKAVAIARDYLNENKIELTCYPDFRVDKRSGLSLVLTKTIRRPSAPDKDVQQLKVCQSHLVQRLREDRFQRAATQTV
jgi:stage V sporulation protein S